MRIHAVFTLTLLRAVAVVLLAFAGCGGPVVQYDAAPKIDYSDFETFVWASYRGDMSPEANEEVLDELIVSSVTKEMADKGFRLIRSGIPDFLVAYHVVATTTTEVEETGISPAWPLPKRLVGIREEGTLIIEIISPDDNTVIWRGWAIRGLHSVRVPVADEVYEVVSGILAQYPST